MALGRCEALLLDVTTIRTVIWLLWCLFALEWGKHGLGGDRKWEACMSSWPMGGIPTSAGLKGRGVY